MSYKKIDFNVPLLQTDGEPQMRQKVDRTKIKRDANGRSFADPILDENGYVVQDPALLSELLATILDNIYTGEEDMDAQARLERGKLARKVGDKNKSSLKNYSDQEIILIQVLLVKAQASPSIVAQIDSIITPTAETEQAAA